ncbi:MAG: ATP synthase F1 subunit delta [Candidatus Dormibacteria bacterium]
MALPIARRYAEAYFALAAEAGKVDEYGTELARAAETLANPEVALALRNPRLPLGQRSRLALDLLDGASREVRNLAHLLVERRRAHTIGDILEAYMGLTDQRSGVIRIEVTTAMPVDDQLEAHITETLHQRLGSSALISFIRDPGILGGLVVRIGDRVIDDSLRTHLQQLQAALA